MTSAYNCEIIIIKKIIMVKIMGRYILLYLGVHFISIIFLTKILCICMSKRCL